MSESKPTDQKKREIIIVGEPIIIDSITINNNNLNHDKIIVRTCIECDNFKEECMSFSCDCPYITD